MDDVRDLPPSRTSKPTSSSLPRSLALPCSRRRSSCRLRKVSVVHLKKVRGPSIQGRWRHARRCPRGRDDARGARTDRAARARRLASARLGTWVPPDRGATHDPRPRGRRHELCLRGLGSENGNDAGGCVRVMNNKPYQHSLGEGREDSAALLPRGRLLGRRRFIGVRVVATLARRRPRLLGRRRRRRGLVQPVL